MVLETQRTLWEKCSRPIINKMDNVDPVVLTWLTLPTGLGAAALLLTADRSAQGGLMLVGAWILMSISMILDGLDGTLARARQKTTRWGDYLDHTLDRVLDVAWVVAIGYNVHWVNNPELGWFAAMTMMFGSYLGTQAQAAAGGRNYGGFSRADRMMLTWLAIINTALMAFMGWSDPAVWFGLGVNPLSLMVLITGLGGIYTYALRFRQARSVLQDLDKSQPLIIEQTDTSSEE
ncbi:MAG: CDP-alcohol phosphatidyltransferase family protein [Candidatus Poseidoniales archaeon]|jgi:archaetidylinositol phosphate synthase